MLSTLRKYWYFEVFQKFSSILYPIIHSILPANIYITYVYLPKCINLPFSFFLILHTHIKQFFSINDEPMMRLLIKSKVDGHFTLKGAL